MKSFCSFQTTHVQVSTHGYSQNQILVWKYPSLTQVAKLTGHSYRVLYLVWWNKRLIVVSFFNKTSMKTTVCTLKCRSPPGRVSRRRSHRYRSRRRDSALLERLQQNALHQGTVKEAAGVEPSTRLQTFSMSTPHAPSFFSQLFYGTCSTYTSLILKSFREDFRKRKAGRLNSSEKYVQTFFL